MAQDLEGAVRSASRLFWSETSSWAMVKGTAKVTIQAEEVESAVKKHLTEALLAQQIYLCEDRDDVVEGHSKFLEAIARDTTRLSKVVVKRAVLSHLRVSEKVAEFFADEMVQALAYVKRKGDGAKSFARITEPVKMVYKAMGCKHMALPTELPQAEAPKGCEAKKANTSTFEDNIARINAVYRLPSTSAPSKAEVVEVLESPKKRCTEEVQDITSSQEEEVRVQKNTQAHRKTQTQTRTHNTQSQLKGQMHRRTCGGPFLWRKALRQSSLGGRAR